MVDLSRLRGTQYGAGHAPGEFYSSQAMDAGSQLTLAGAIEGTGPLMEPVFLSSKAGVVQYYKDVYGESTGKGGWKDHLAHDKALLTGEKAASVRRSLDADRIHQSGARQDWAKLGKTLPPSGFVPRKPRGARVSFSIYFKISNSYKQVSQTVDLTDSQTMRLLEEGDFDAVLEAYQLNNIDQLEELDIGSLDIELLE